MYISGSDSPSTGSTVAMVMSLGGTWENKSSDIILVVVGFEQIGRLASAIVRNLLPPPRLGLASCFPSARGRRLSVLRNVFRHVLCRVLHVLVLHVSPKGRRGERAPPPGPRRPGPAPRPVGYRNDPPLCTRMCPGPFFEAPPPDPPVKTGTRVRRFRGCSYFELKGEQKNARSVQKAN